MLTYHSAHCLALPNVFSGGFLTVTDIHVMWTYIYIIEVRRLEKHNY